MPRACSTSAQASARLASARISTSRSSRSARRSARSTSGRSRTSASTSFRRRRTCAASSAPMRNRWVSTASRSSTSTTRASRSARTTRRCGRAGFQRRGAIAVRASRGWPSPPSWRSRSRPPSSSRRGGSVGRRTRRCRASPRRDPRPPQTTTANGTSRLVVRAIDGSSWMEVRLTSRAGKLLYSGTLEQGQRKAFEGRSLQLALAEPDNVAVRVNGNRVDLPAGTTFVVTARRITRATS